VENPLFGEAAKQCHDRHLYGSELKLLGTQHHGWRMAIFHGDMAIEIVDFPMKNGGSFHSYGTVYQRVTTTVIWQCVKTIFVPLRCSHQVIAGIKWM